MFKPGLMRILLSGFILICATACGGVSMGGEKPTSESTIQPSATPIPMSVCQSYNLFMSDFNEPVRQLLLFSQPPDGSLAGDPVFQDINAEVNALSERITEATDRIPSEALGPWDRSYTALMGMDLSMTYYLEEKADPLLYETPMPPWTTDIWNVGTDITILEEAINDPVFASCQFFHFRAKGAWWGSSLRAEQAPQPYRRFLGAQGPADTWH